MAASTMLVLPSLEEGFGLPVAEAMAAGLPVVCSRGSALEEVAGGAATLVDPLNTRSLADGIESLLDDPARAAEQRRARPRAEPAVRLGPRRPPDARLLRAGRRGLTPSPPQPGDALRIGVDARELTGRPTGTGRYLRNLLRAFTRDHGDTVVAYFNGDAPADAVLDHPNVVVRALPRARPGLLWQQRRLPAAARRDALDVLFCPAYTCPLGARPAARDDRPRPVVLRAARRLHLARGPAPAPDASRSPSARRGAC